VGWGCHYLVTVMDDYTRPILALTEMRVFIELWLLLLRRAEGFSATAGELIWFSASPKDLMR
jgi:hypothetical protein